MKELIDVLIEVCGERVRQDKKWGGPDHDDNHATLDFLGFIMSRVETASDRELTNNHDKLIDRKELIEIAALAVAAVESIDRKKIDNIKIKVPCMGDLAYQQNFPITANPYKTPGQQELLNKWTSDWVNAQHEDIPF